MAELRRRAGINPSLYYNWSKEFLEAGKKRFKGDTQREAASGEVSALQSENVDRKQLVADQALEIRKLKKISGLLNRLSLQLISNYGEQVAILKEIEPIGVILT